MTQVCPYCARTIEDPTQDHIFSEFLGGRRTIPACRKCNSLFGQSFEGRYSQALLRIKTWLTMSGLPIKWQREFRWKKALTYKGMVSDLLVKDGKVLIVQAAPHIVRDEGGRPVQVRARTVAEANSIVAGLRRKDLITAASEASPEWSPASVDGFEFEIDFGPDLGQLCLKMCSAAATLLDDFGPVSSLLRHGPLRYSNLAHLVTDIVPQLTDSV